jgi:HSP20 family protein
VSEWRKRRKHFPWWFNVIEEMERMNEMMDEMMHKAFKMPREAEAYSPYVYGFSLSIDPEGKPIIREFGNVQPTEAGPQLKEEYEPLMDVMEEDDEIVIVAELPGVERDDIKLQATEESLTISVDRERRKYRKELKLPKAVDPASSRASYKNGVLEIRLKKVKAERLMEKIKI